MWPDQRIRERLVDKGVLFLTQDEDFVFNKPTEAIVHCGLHSERVQTQEPSDRLVPTGGVLFHIPRCPTSTV